MRPSPQPSEGAEADDEPLLSSGEVMRRSGVSRQVLYQYTAIGLIEETSTTPGGHRRYPERVVRHLALIRALKETGYTLRDIREVFFSRRRAPAERRSG